MYDGSTSTAEQIKINRDVSELAVAALLNFEAKENDLFMVVDGMAVWHDTALQVFMLSAATLVDLACE